MINGRSALLLEHYTLQAKTEQKVLSLELISPVFSCVGLVVSVRKSTEEGRATQTVFLGLSRSSTWSSFPPYTLSCSANWKSRHKFTFKTPLPYTFLVWCWENRVQYSSTTQYSLTISAFPKVLAASALSLSLPCLISDGQVLTTQTPDSATCSGSRSSASGSCTARSSRVPNALLGRQQNSAWRQSDLRNGSKTWLRQ